MDFKIRVLTKNILFNQLQCMLKDLKQINLWAFFTISRIPHGIYLIKDFCDQKNLLLFFGLLIIIIQCICRCYATMKKNKTFIWFFLWNLVIVKRCCTYIINTCYNAKHSNNFDPELRNDAKRTNGCCSYIFREKNDFKVENLEYLYIIFLVQYWLYFT